MEYCEVSDCLEPAEEHRRVCRFHRERKANGVPNSTPKRGRLGSFGPVVEAAARMMDAESDAQFRAAKERLRRAAKAWKGD